MSDLENNKRAVIPTRLLAELVGEFGAQPIDLEFRSQRTS
jgi:hypothetical protein